MFHNLYVTKLEYTYLYVLNASSPQQYFVCDYAVNVDCVAAEGFYSLNDNFGAETDDSTANLNLDEDDVFARR